jgi:Peptidase family M1 domain/Secretion system C-terminal sorting domain/Peptidase M1 N-terminal domain
LHLCLTIHFPFFLLQISHLMFKQTKVVITTFCILANFLAYAQPMKQVGCHFLQNQGVQRRAYTDLEKAQINESILRSDTFNILTYHINIDVTNYTGGYIKAATTIDFVPLMTNQSFVRFDLKDLVVDSVKAANDNLSFAQTGELLYVYFNSPPVLTDTMHITVHYQGNPYQDPTWGGFYFEANYIYNLGIGLTTIPPNFGRVWYPCFDSFVERATYEYNVKSAGTYRAHCQGTFMGETQLAGDTVIRSFQFNQPIPTHLSAIAVANYSNFDYVHTGAYGNIPVRLSAKPANLTAMQNTLVNVGAAIDACEYWYGPYAWERVGYVYTTDGALEIPTNIAYPQFMAGQTVADNNNLLSHELGHSWWGDAVTPYNHNDMWLKEGPAEYSSHLLEEWLNGEAGFVDMVKDNQLRVLQDAHIDDGTFQPLSPMPDEYIYGTHTYYKGAAVMHNLRAYMGDELFRQAMSGVQANHLYETITPEQFRDMLEEESGVSLDDFFNDQVFSPGFSTFVVDSAVVTEQGGNYQVNTYIQQKLRACPQYHTNVPLDVTFISNNWEREEHQIIASGQLTQINLMCSFEPAMVVLNGHNRLNQCRMEFQSPIYTTGTWQSNLPYANFRFTRNNVVDSSLVHVEHIWAAPDQNNLGPGIYEISNVHYWIVDGLWDTEDSFEGKLQYYGSDVTELDYDLYHNGEQNAVLLYRQNSGQPWQVYPDFTLGTGSLDNGDGSININVLRKGQYAFANGDASVAVNEIKANKNNLLIYPVPTSSTINVAGNFNGNETALFDIYSTEGRLVMRSSSAINGAFNKQLDMTNVEVGHYILKAYTLSGAALGTSTFEVVR